MVGAGEKIKEAVTGHNNNNTATNNKNDSLACEDRGAQHHTGHAHHDPEADAKKATSAAGNYPYWGNLERDGEGHRSEGGIGGNTGSRDSTQHGSHGSHGNTAGVGAGALAAGAGAAGAGHHLGSREGGREQDPLYASTRDAQTMRRNHPGEGSTTSGQTYPTSANNTNHLRGHEGALAGAAGDAGAGYPASGDRNERIHNTTSSGDRDSRREKEYLGAGAGAAGVAGAGYLASRDRRDENPSSTSTGPGPEHRNIAFASGTAPGTQTHDRSLPMRDTHNTPGGHPSTVPSSFDQLNTPSRGADPYAGGGTSSPSTTGPGQHHDGHSHRRGEEALGAAGLGAAAGYAGTEAGHRHHHNDDATGGAVYSGSGPDGYNPNDPTPAQLAAQRAWSNENPGISGAFPESGGGLQHDGGLRSGGNDLSSSNNLRSDNPLRSDNNNNYNNENLGRSDKHGNLRSEAEYAAAGAGLGGLATREHERHGHGHDKNYQDPSAANPSRTLGADQTPGLHHRRMGSDTTDHAPNSQLGVGRSSGAGSRRGSSAVAGEGGEVPKVVHKCVKCGHSNDISHYAPLFRKDATPLVPATQP